MPDADAKQFTVTQICLKMHRTAVWEMTPQSSGQYRRCPPQRASVLWGTIALIVIFVGLAILYFCFGPEIPSPRLPFAP